VERCGCLWFLFENKALSETKISDTVRLTNKHIALNWGAGQGN
jgi:hypothetical protein